MQIDRIIFCLFLQEDVKIYENLMQVYFPVGDIHNNLWSTKAEINFCLTLTGDQIKCDAWVYLNAIDICVWIVSTIRIVIIWIYVCMLSYSLQYVASV